MSFDPAAFQSLRRSAFGAELRCFERLGSTQDAALQAVTEGAEEGCCVLAEAQDAGRGRWGRQWSAAPGQSLLFTVVLDELSGAGEPGSLPLVLGVGTARALRVLGLEEIQLKWPNDLLWRGKKLGGFLIEAREGKWLAGLGLNLTQSAEDFGPELAATAVSLREAGIKTTREEILADLLAAWQYALDGWRREGSEDWAFDWQQHDALRGKTVRAELDGLPVEGRADGVEEDGRLRLVLPDGRLKRLASGDVTLLRPTGPA
jgi:BirA family biotin operon repressor/biotin-[acetyl-CoA-carboxylase] ligase